MAHYSYYLSDRLDRDGFVLWFDAYEATVHTDCNETLIKRTKDHTVAITLNPAVHHQTLQDARCAAIEELHRRIGVIREQISQLRTDYLNHTEVADAL